MVLAKEKKKEKKKKSLFSWKLELPQPVTCCMQTSKEDICSILRRIDKKCSWKM